MRFSLVIPCYNEAANLPLLLERCKELATQSDIEVVLVDNGSTDSTPELLLSMLPKYPGCRSVRVDKNQGYGFGIVSGLKAANGEILGWTHADMQTDPLDALRGLALFEKHGDNIFAKGRRYGRSVDGCGLHGGHECIRNPAVGAADVGYQCSTHDVFAQFF